MSDFRAYDEEWRGKRSPSALHWATADPTLSGHLLHRNLSVGATLSYGMVADATPYLHSYRVMLERGGGVKVCVAGTQTSMLPYGSRQVTTLAPGTHVWVLIHPQLEYGVILCTEPSASLDPRLAMSDWVHQASRSGLRVDAAHRTVFDQSLHGGVRNWAAGRPFDGTTAGEWGAMTETGLRVLLDSFMAQLAVDESTGIFAFYLDQLLRVCGYNFEEFSASHLREILHDEGEISNLEGYATYPHEHLGLFALGNPWRPFEPESVQISEPHYAAQEPGSDRQQPFHRLRVFRGYLGQGETKNLCAPPTSLGTLDSSLYETRRLYPGLFEEHLSLTGQYSLRSAKGILIAKTPAIPVPSRLRRPEDKEGDNPENYRASGLLGEGDEHKVHDELSTTETTHPQLQRACGIADWCAYLFNWDGLHPFRYHLRDWDLPEEEEQPAGVQGRPVRFSDLAGQVFLAPPAPVSVTIDHRYPTTQIYPNTSYFALLPDGGVVLTDGFGSELRMTGGQITLAAPGDIVLQPGKNLTVLAGRDAVVRAKNSIDLSASKKDVRVKAERNLHMLGGNDSGDTSAAGGVVLESRAAAAYQYADRVGEDVVTGGVQIKAKEGDFAVWARSIYLRTGGGDVASGGGITLDAGAGQSPLVVQAQSVARYITGAAADYFGSEGAVQQANIFSANSNLLGAGLSVNGFGSFTNGVQIKGHLAILGGHLWTELSEQYNYLVGAPGPGESLQRAYDSYYQVLESVVQIVQDGTAFYAQYFTEGLYGEERVGSDQTISQAGFSFRNEAQYGTTNQYALWETRWQQLARLGNVTLQPWEESAVQAGSAQTYPYPGLAPWTQTENFFEQDLQLFDATRQVSVSRSEHAELYEEAKYLSPTTGIPNERYMVIV